MVSCCWLVRRETRKPWQSSEQYKRSGKGDGHYCAKGSDLYYICGAKALISDDDYYVCVETFVASCKKCLSLSYGNEATLRTRADHALYQ